MKMTINGFELEYKMDHVGLDSLSCNPENARTEEEQAWNAQRIYNSMRPVEGKDRRVAYRSDKMTLYVVKSGKVMCGNGTLGALQLWSSESPDSFLKQFPERKIPVTMFDKLSPVELLAIAADHSDGFNSKELSIEQTALEFRRMMDRRRKDSLIDICSKLGYSTGKGKVYYHLEVAHRDCTKLFDILWAGAILKVDGNKIRLTHLSQIAAQWSNADGFADSNSSLWDLVECLKVFGNSKGNAPKQTDSDKLALVQTYRDKLVDVSIKADALTALVDAVIAGDYASTKVAIVSIDKLLV